MRPQLPTDQQIAKHLDDTIDQMLAYAYSRKLVKKPDQFDALLTREYEPEFDGAKAGLDQGGVPTIVIGLSGRMYAWENALDSIGSLSNPIPNRAWEKARKAALQGEWMFVEYARHMNDPEIGSIALNTWQEHAACTAAHELAHAIQVWNQDPGYKVGHGQVWQRLYREFRRHLGFTQDGRKDIPVKRHDLPFYAQHLPGAWQQPGESIRDDDGKKFRQQPEQINLAI